jgi:hypothetical protein
MALPVLQRENTDIQGKGIRSARRHNIHKFTCDLYSQSRS